MKFYIFGLVVFLFGAGVSGCYFFNHILCPDYEVVVLPMTVGSDFHDSNFRLDCMGVYGGHLNRADVGLYAVSALNDSGQVVGHFHPPKNWFGRGFVLDEENGFVGRGKLEDEFCFITDINNKGQSVGWISKSGAWWHGNCDAFFMDSDGSITLLPFEVDTSSYACGINDRGAVVGIMEIRYPVPRVGLVTSNQVFVWDKEGGMRVIDGTRGSNISVAGINEAGQIAGKVHGKVRGFRGFFWSESSGLVYIDLNVSEVFGIDEDGNVAGSCYQDGGKLFAWNEKTGVKLLDVGGYPSECRMNDKGDIVGSYCDRGIELFNKYQIVYDKTIPFVHTRGGKTVSLDRLFKKEERFCPIDINNDGVIVGYVLDRSQNGGCSVVLLRPE